MEIRSVEEWLADLRTQEAYHDSQLRRIRSILQFADGEIRSGNTNTTDMALDLFRENPKDAFSAAEVEAEIRERGWVTDSADPVNAVRAALNRLKNNNEIETIGRGRFILRADDPWASAPPESRAPVDDDEPPF